jgi:hypothetical protein
MQIPSDDNRVNSIAGWLYKVFVNCTAMAQCLSSVRCCSAKFQLIATTAQIPIGLQQRHNFKCACDNNTKTDMIVETAQHHVDCNNGGRLGALETVVQQWYNWDNSAILGTVVVTAQQCINHNDMARLSTVAAMAQSLLSIVQPWRNAVGIRAAATQSSKSTCNGRVRVVLLLDDGAKPALIM